MLYTFQVLFVIQFIFIDIVLFKILILLSIIQYMSFDILAQLESISDFQVADRNQKIRKYLKEQKEQLILHLVEQEHEILTVKKNKYVCCQEDLQIGLNMFVQASKSLLDVYFPIFMDENYLQLLSECEIDEKMIQLKNIIEKNWNYIYKQLVKPKEQIQEMKNRAISQDKKKGKNVKIPAESASVMQKWLLQNFSDPYPSHSKKVQMARQSNLSLYQVNNWFINARERVVKKFYKKQNEDKQT